MATVRLQTKVALSAQRDVQAPPDSVDLKFWAALRDSTNGPLTVEVLGEAGARAFELDGPGDVYEFPLHGVGVVRLSAATYPCVIGYGIVPTGARIRLIGV